VARLAGQFVFVCSRIVEDAFSRPKLCFRRWFAKCGSSGRSDWAFMPGCVTFISHGAVLVVLSQNLLAATRVLDMVIWVSGQARLSRLSGR
jgi:hypothetical protein